MSRWPHIRQCLLLALAVLLLGACAAPSSPSGGPDVPYWQGKLSIKVYSHPPQVFSANFDLRGAPERGQLVLSSPLGTTLAELQWTPHTASMRTSGEERHFDSLDTLAQQVTGADIPVASLFDWLQGKPGAPGHWVADFSELEHDRILAHNVGQTPASELKIILER